MTEWVQDWYDENYYSYAPEKNPKGPDFGTEKVLRGGGKGGIRHTPVWSRHPEPPLWDEEWTGLMKKSKEEGRDIELNKENPTSHRYGFRCALNHTKPVSVKDLKLSNE